MLWKLLLKVVILILRHRATSLNDSPCASHTFTQVRLLLGKKAVRDLGKRRALAGEHKALTRFCPQHHRGKQAASKTQTVLPTPKALSEQRSIVGRDGPHADTLTKPKMGQLMTIKHLSPHRTVWETRQERKHIQRGSF